MCTASAKNCSVGNGNVLLEFIFFWGGGNPNNKSASNLLLSIVSGWLAVSLHYCNGLNAVMD